MKTSLALNAKRILLAALLGALMPQAAIAATCGTGLDPILLQATATAFGVYSPGSGSAVTANGTVTVACTSPITDTLPSFAVALDGGGAGSFSPRQMSFGSARLNYNLYTSSSYTTIWGDGTNGTVTQSYDSGSAQGTVNFTAFGNLPAGQFATPGLYTDTITVTVSY
jgi:spore coat protein U domain-containing protein, fimbrial subunit CupE1/2/3/6